MVLIPTHRPPAHPGEVLLHEFLEELGFSQTDAAEQLGISFVRLNAIIKGRRGVTPDTALRLERLFGLSAQAWLNMQVAWDLYQARHSPEAKDIAKIRRHRGLHERRRSA
jgi:antitoxin HigA-1